MNVGVMNVWFWVGGDESPRWWTSEFSKGVMNVLGDECPGDECRTICKNTQIQKYKWINTKTQIHMKAGRSFPSLCQWATGYKGSRLGMLFIISILISNDHNRHQGVADLSISAERERAKQARNLHKKEIPPAERLISSRCGLHNNQGQGLWP